MLETASSASSSSTKLGNHQQPTSTFSRTSTPSQHNILANACQNSQNIPDNFTSSSVLSTPRQPFESVRVGVRIRPQGQREIDQGAVTCIHVPDPNHPQIITDTEKAFTYDYAFDQDVKQKQIFNSTTRELVDSLFDGYNSTVLAYGQTGSGKTFTMGTSFETQTMEFSEDDPTVGIVPRALKHVYQTRDYFLNSSENEIEQHFSNFKFSISFLELYNENICDLLSPINAADQNLKVVEDSKGAVQIPGLTQVPVDSYERTMQVLRKGALKRTTASTAMNETSSRSHAIFTLHLSCNKTEEVVTVDGTKSIQESNIVSKFHFVDLAGSEKIKKTKAEGDRKREGININFGLLILGNVISVLGDPKRKSGHVPYRDSKLTRILQDSLGGNSQTCMIACLSPSDSEFTETLGTLRYADRAKNIKNKVVQNQDGSSKQVAELREELRKAKAELDDWRCGRRILGEDGDNYMNDMCEENKLLLQENRQLTNKINALNNTVVDQKRRLIDAQSVNYCSEVGQISPRRASKNSPQDSDNVEDNIHVRYLEDIENLRMEVINKESEITRLNRQLDRGSRPSTAKMDNSGGYSLLEKAKLELNSMTSIHENDVPSDNEEAEDNNKLTRIQEQIISKEELVFALEESLQKQQDMEMDYGKQIELLRLKINEKEKQKEQALADLEKSSPKKGADAQKIVAVELKKVRTKYEKEISDYRKKILILQKQQKDLSMQARKNWKCFVSCSNPSDHYAVRVLTWTGSICFWSQESSSFLTL